MISQHFCDNSCSLGNTLITIDLDPNFDSYELDNPLYAHIDLCNEYTRQDLGEGHFKLKDNFRYL